MSSILQKCPPMAPTGHETVLKSVTLIIYFIYCRMLTGSLSNRNLAGYYPMQLNIIRNTTMFSAKQKFYDRELKTEFSKIILFKDPKRNLAVV
jgi:hypothetical protein